MRLCPCCQPGQEFCRQHKSHPPALTSGGFQVAAGVCRPSSQPRPASLGAVCPLAEMAPWGWQELWWSLSGCWCESAAEKLLPCREVGVWLGIRVPGGVLLCCLPRAANPDWHNLGCGSGGVNVQSFARTCRVVTSHRAVTSCCVSCAGVSLGSGAVLSSGSGMGCSGCSRGVWLWWSSQATGRDEPGG